MGLSWASKDERLLRSPLCVLGFHHMRGTIIPHVFKCIRPGCDEMHGGHP